jgi:hypothetical protein
VSNEKPARTPGPKRAGARTYTVLGLFGLFIAAVLVVIARRAVPGGRVSHAVEGALRRRR